MASPSVYWTSGALVTTSHIGSRAWRFGNTRSAIYASDIISYGEKFCVRCIEPYSASISNDTVPSRRVFARRRQVAQGTRRRYQPTTFSIGFAHLEWAPSTTVYHGLRAGDAPPSSCYHKPITWYARPRCSCIHHHSATVYS